MSLFVVTPIERGDIFCVLGEYWNVAGLIPVGVIFHLLIPSARIVALESPQPLTEVSTGIYPWR
jgi:hypothetical protein